MTINNEDLTLKIEQLMTTLSVIERDYEDSFRRNKKTGNIAMAEWYDGAAHGILRAKELLMDEMPSI